MEIAPIAFWVAVGICAGIAFAAFVPPIVAGITLLALGTALNIIWMNAE